ncbi:MAG TPA: ThuA domain-containing protein [Gemmataceae bacterium]|nr:ThuA domain-containing protein [Gemmataceae bacterium]
MQTRRKVIGALAALGLCGVITAGVSNRACAADAPKPKEADVQKMEAALPDKAYAKPEKARKVLIYGNAQGFVHSSIPLGEVTIEKLGEKTGAWTGTISNDPAAFDNLKDYDAVVLVSTTGHFLLPKGPEGRNVSEEQKKEFEQKVQPDKQAEERRLQNLVDFVKGGKGLAGIHASTDAYYDKDEYGNLIGGRFSGHKSGKEEISVVNEDPSNPVNAAFNGKGFEYADEIYRFKDPAQNKSKQTYDRGTTHVLLSVDISKHNNEPQGTDMPVAWIRKVGDGRVFYCSLGHNEFVYQDPNILKFYLAGIQFATGDLQASTSPSGAKPSAAAK